MNKSENRINIIGASGVGKSTLGKALAQELDIPHFDSDIYYHEQTDPPFQRQRSPDERLRLLMADVGGHTAWVLTGGAATWQPKPPLNYSLVIFMTLPLDARLERLRQRELVLYGSRISDGGDMAAIHREFMEWTRGYDDGTSEGTNTLPLHEKFLAGVSCPVIRLQASVSVEENLRTIVRKLAGR